MEEVDALALADAPERYTERRLELRDLPKPEPSAGMAALKAELELALAADPRKKANYERYLASRRRSAVVDYLPITLDIENVSRCNFRCTMCVVSDWPKGKRGPDMQLADFKRMIDDQFGLVVIKLQGIGEPTMQGDPYFEMIKYARSKHIWVRSTTNASLLHLKDRYKKMIEFWRERDPDFDRRRNERSIRIDKTGLTLRACRKKLSAHQQLCARAGPPRNQNVDTRSEGQ